MNASLNPNRLEEAYQRIDEALERHRNSILALSSQRNDLAYISRLPPEILSRIFSFAQSKNVFRWLPPSRWIKLTHVCRHWRHVAITSPALWAELPIRNRQWLKESLKRSKLVGLVVICPRSERDISGLNLALRHITQIRYLSLSLNSTTRNIISDKPMSAPRLEYLCLERVDLSDNLLCEMKELRHLELTGCRIDWDSPLYFLPSITHLTLNNLTQKSKLSRKRFVDAMKMMPNLEVLELEDALPIEGTLWTFDRTHFNLLRSLAVTKSTPIESELFFLCFTFPPTAMVIVDCSLDSDTDHSCVISGLSGSYLPKLSDSHFQTFILVQSMSARICVKLFKDTLTDHQLRGHSLLAPALEMQFCFTDKTSAQDVSKLFDTLFDGAIPLQGIQRIHLEGLWHLFNPELLANTLGRLPQVHSAMVGKDNGRLFFEVLRHNSSIEDVVSIVPIGKCSFPRLSSIYLHGIKFEAPHGRPTDLPFPSLRNCLMDRHKCDAAINKLTLDGCHELPEDIITSLKDFVADVQIVDSKEKQVSKQGQTYVPSDADMEENSEEETEEETEETEEETEETEEETEEESEEEWD